MRLGIGITLPGRANAQAGSALEPETTALLARMSVQPTTTRTGQINALVKALKTAGVWAKLDCLYLLAAHDAQAARLNWKSSNYDLTLINSPVFTLDRGYQGDGTTSRLGSGFNPVTAGGLFSLNNASLFHWSLTAAGGGTDIGNSNSRAGQRAAGGMSLSPNAGATAIGSPNYPGLFGWSRTSSGSYFPILKGAAGGAGAVASTSVTSSELGVCGLGDVASFGLNQNAAAGWGASLSSSSDVPALTTALQTYLQGVGAV